MMFVHWTRDKGKPPGVWAIHNVLNAAEAAEAVKASIPKAKGYIDGIALNIPAAVDLDEVKQAVYAAVPECRPLEAPLDIVFIWGDELAAALRFK